MKRILSALMFFAVAISPLAGQDVIDRIVAIVDENIILQSELNQFAYTYAVQSKIDISKNPEAFAALREKILDELIIQKVLLVKAKEDSIEVDARQIDSMLDEQIKGMVRQVGSEKKLEDELGMSMRKIRNRFREQIEERALVENLKSKKLATISVGKGEIEEFYKTMKDSLPRVEESVNLSHILVSVSAGGDAREKALAKIKEVQQKLEAGEPFEKLAQEYSDDPSGSRGGDLGFIQRGDLVVPYEEAAFALEIGQISDIVETEFGFHIIKLEDRLGEKIRTRHILVQVPITDEDEKRTLAFLDSLRSAILAGEISFTDAAKKYSEDETTREQGGNLGWFEIRQIQLPEFKQVAETLEVGDISHPIKGQVGYHLVRLNDKKAAREISFDEDYEQLKAWALQLKREKFFRSWVQELKKEFYIKKNT
ncbi:MAG TPA: hypothetical protein ENJ29_16035 [Bacteroidetes bacterium]|nr:hypothetical protein [Bacteroidota bacterium]